MFDNIQPVSITERACAEIHQIRQAKGIPADYGLRVGVKGGGCGGASFIIGFDKKRDSDITFAVAGITVHVDKKHAMYLVGKRVDFIDEADRRGFTFLDGASGSG